MSDTELIVTVAKEIFFKLLESDNTKTFLKIDFRDANFLATFEKSFNSVLQVVSKAVRSIND